MISNSLFFLAIGFITSYYYNSLTKEGNLSYALGAIAVVTAFSSLYFGRLADKINTRKLLFIFVPISTISIFFLQSFLGQITFAVFSTLITLLIEINTSNQKGKSGDKFGKLNFYVQMSYAISILIGGFLVNEISIIISVILLVAFYLIILCKQHLISNGLK